MTVLEERTEKLEVENRALLERWMTRISAEAEKMNDANEFLERIRGMRMSSPGTVEENNTPEEKQEDS